MPANRTSPSAKGGGTRRSPRAAALRFVVIIGILSLFADCTYEGARAINGPYLAVLGATATTVGLISGAGELLGYLVRLLSGSLASRTGRYWLWTTPGYLVNLFAAPALAWAGSWPLASGLIIAERIGKGLRNPPRDAMLANAGSVIGHGWAFALRETLDQTGAMTGPLLVGGILFYQHGNFSSAYGWLLIPALASLLALAFARWQFPTPRMLELDDNDQPSVPRSVLPTAFWHYLAAMALMAVGYADFNLLSFHLEKVDNNTAVIPLLYTLAMGTAGLSALVFGRWFDRYGLRALAVATLVSAVATPLVILGDLGLAAAGVAAWGIGLGIQDSLMNAPLSMMIQPDRRAHAFGVFNALYGIAWFTGSSLLGVIYDHSVTAVVVVSVTAQLIAVVILASIRRQAFTSHSPT